MEFSIPKFSRRSPKHRDARENPGRELAASAFIHDFRSLDTEEGYDSGEKEEVRESLTHSAEEPAIAVGEHPSDSKAITSSPAQSLQLVQHDSQMHNPCGSSALVWQGFFRLHQSVRRFSSFPPFGFGKMRRRRRKRGDSAMEDDSVEYRPSSAAGWRTFTKEELQKATDNFSSGRLIGKGGSADIYRGCLRSGEQVAVKRMTGGTPEERSKNLLSELGVLGHIDHPNTARLVGVGVEGGMHLVLVLSPHGSLDNFIYQDAKERLNWGERYKIAVGTARGLEYLHERCHHRIIHRDIKSSNILLAQDFEPQICDFGLAKWLPDEVTHHTMFDFEGTFGYVAPEYCMHGIVDEKTDVFAYGIILLELITGRRAVDKAQSVLTWAKPYLEQRKFMDLVDPSLGDSCDYNQLHNAARAAHACVQHSPVLRPRMSQVLTLLTGIDAGLDETPRTPSLHMRRTFSDEIFEFEDTIRSTQSVDLDSLSRHRQIALDF